MGRKIFQHRAAARRAAAMQQQPRKPSFVALDFLFTFELIIDFLRVILFAVHFSSSPLLFSMVIIITKEYGRLQ